ncbi:MAG: hypothetical protein WBG50_04905 [Desulfomonilaceae bacterium]
MDKAYSQLSHRMLTCPGCRKALKQEFSRWYELIPATMVGDSGDLAWEVRNAGSCPICGRDVRDQYLIYLKMIRDRMSLPALSPKLKATILTFLEIKSTGLKPQIPAQECLPENSSQHEIRAAEIKLLYDDLLVYLEQLSMKDPNDLAFSTDLTEYDEILTKLTHLDSENYRGFRLHGTDGIKSYLDP